jgi:Fe-S cluster assembly iron-binding protein IscA
MVSCGIRKAYSVSVDKHLQRLRKRSEDNIKRDIRKTGCEDMNCQLSVCRSWNHKQRPISAEKKGEEGDRHVRHNRQ